MKRKLILALPGNEFRSDVMLQTIKFLDWCSHNDWDIILSMKGGSNVSIVREACLGLNEVDVINTDHQAPFYGKMEYDYILWVDSDIVWKPEHFVQLVDDNEDIVAGLYKKAPTQFTATEWKPNTPIEYLECLTDKDLEGRTEPFECIGFGFGFVLIKKGVFERVRRPWFMTQVYKVPNADKPRVVGEDIYFCLRAREAGYTLWADPRVKLVHIKGQGLI
jgi:hypothetical protein